MQLMEAFKNHPQSSNGLVHSQASPFFAECGWRPGSGARAEALQMQAH